MVYQVFARKWRPLLFEEVVNQSHVKTTLINAIKLKRIAHAYIFAGPRGVGKTTIARILARALNCEQGPTPSPCNECTPCTEIIEDRSMDVMEIDGASNRGIEDVRNIRENVKYAPIHGKYRIYIIDEVHMLTREAFNALLKTLEEPPSHVLFIFATTEFQKIPATIISRCQRFDFKRLPIEEIVRQLKMICKAEQIILDEEAMILLSKRAEGSMRDAESLLDQLVSFCGSTIKTEDFFDVIGMIREDVYFSCSEAIISRKLSEGFTIAQKLFDEGYDPGEFINGLLEHFRNMLVCHLAGNADMIETSEPFQRKYMETAPNFSEMDILRILNTISDAEYHIKKSTQPLLRLELMMSKLIAMDKSVTIGTILDSIQQNGDADDSPSGFTSQRSEQPGSVAREKPKPYNAGQLPLESDTDKIKSEEIEKETIRDNRSTIHETRSLSEKQISKLTLKDIKERWNEFVTVIQKESAITGSFLKEGTPTAFKDNTIQITFKPENGFHIDSIERNRTKLNQNIERIFGANIGFTCVKRELSHREKKSVLKKIEINSQKDRLQKILDREPIIKTIIETFGAESINIRTD